MLSLLLAWGATILAKAAPTARRTYGLRKATVLASLANAVLLLVAVAFRRAGNIAMHEATMGRLRADFPESDAARNSSLAVR